MRFGRYDYAAFTSFFSYSSGWVVIPVALIFVARELGFPLESGGLSAGGMLHLGRTLPMVVSMLLCGFIAGRWGKRRSFGWAVVLMGLGMGLCAWSPGYGVLLLALMIAGLGEGILEGLATPFVQDLHPQEPGRYINFAHSFWSIGVLTTVLISGALLSLGISWRILVSAISLLSLIAAAMLLLPEREGHRYPEHPEPIHWTTVWAQAVSILRIPRFWLFFAAMFVAGGGEFCLTFWCASYIQLNFSAAAWAGGVGTACFAGGMVLGRTGWGYLIDQHHLRALIVGSALAGTLLTLPFPLLNHLGVFFVLLFLAGLATAPFWPSVQSYCSDRLPESDTTLLFILLSCAGIPGCGFFTWLMGYIGGAYGNLDHAFYLIPACFLTLAALMGYDWFSSRPRNGQPMERSA
jgi:MFS family permease